MQYENEAAARYLANGVFLCVLPSRRHFVDAKIEIYVYFVVVWVVAVCFRLQRENT